MFCIVDRSDAARTILLSRRVVGTHQFPFAFGGNQVVLLAVRAIQCCLTLVHILEDHDRDEHHIDNVAHRAHRLVGKSFTRKWH